MKKLVILLFVLYNHIGLAQNPTMRNWTFGRRVGITFEKDTIKQLPNRIEQKTNAFNDPGVASFVEGCATISDSLGNLLFYTNGERIWNNTHQVMQGAATLGGHASGTQSVLIIKQPQQPHLYYVFQAKANETRYFASQIPFLTTPYISYTIVDMQLDNGRGGIYTDTSGITHLDIPIARFAGSEKLTATRACQNGHWVVFHDLADRFYTYRLESNGIDTNVIISKTGPTFGRISGTTLVNSGYMKFSYDGRFLVACNGNRVDMFNFNKNTGIFSFNQSFVLPNATGCYGVAFSPNDSLFYVSARGAYNSIIYQFERFQPNIAASVEVIIDSVLRNYPIFGSGREAQISALQTGLDGRIYAVIPPIPHIDDLPKTTYLSVIKYPNKKGKACQFIHHGLPLSIHPTNLTQAIGHGLPNFVDGDMFSNEVRFRVSQQRVCVGDTIQLEDASLYSPQSFYWDLGNLQTDTGKAISVTYTKAGNYKVKLTVDFGCYQDTASATISVGNCPVASFEAVEQDSCAELSVLYRSTSQYADSTVWQINTTFFQDTVVAQSLLKDSLQTVRLWVFNAWGKDSISTTSSFSPVSLPCFSVDTSITDVALFIPNILTPNQTNFEIKNYEFFAPIALKIYNRWGKLIYENNNYRNDWNTENLPSGTYFIHLTTRTGKIHKGWVQVVK